MQQAFGLQDLDGSILAVGASREAIQKIVDSHLLYGIGTNIIQLEINTEPLTERGIAIQEEIRRVWDAKGITNFHFDRQPGWYRLSADERAQTILNLLTIDVFKNGE
jgi:hypothetical protein